MVTKWKIPVLGILIISLMALPLLIATTRSGSSTWSAFRTVVATEGANYTAATQKDVGDSTADGTVWYLPPNPTGAILVRFKGTNAQNLTMTWCLWARMTLSDPAEFVAYGTATTGLSQTGATDEFYCDTIVITGQSWYTTVSVVDGAPEAIIAGGGISKLAVDSCEYQVWEIKIYDIAGGGAEAVTAGADLANFKL